MEPEELTEGAAEGPTGERGQARLVHLVRRAQRGDAGAFACLVERHQPLLARFCRQLVRDEVAAQDLAQETLLHAQQALGRLAQPARFGAWLCGIATNLARTWWRRQRRAPVSLDGLLTAQTAQTAHGELAGDSALLVCLSPEEIVEEAEQAQRVLAAIESLPAPLGHVVALCCLQGLSYAEVGAALQVPVSTIKSRLFHSRAKLRLALVPERAPAGAPAAPAARPSKRSPPRRAPKEATNGRDSAMTTSPERPQPSPASPPPATAPKPTIACSFCGKPPDQVRRLIAGPHFVYICDDCVGKCNAILAAEAARSTAGGA